MSKQHESTSACPREEPEEHAERKVTRELERECEHQSEMRLNDEEISHRELEEMKEQPEFEHAWSVNSLMLELKEAHTPLLRPVFPMPPLSFSAVQPAVRHHPLLPHPRMIPLHAVSRPYISQ